MYYYISPITIYNYYILLVENYLFHNFRHWVRSDDALLEKIVPMYIDINLEGVDWDKGYWDRGQRYQNGEFRGQDGSKKVDTYDKMVYS